MDITWMWFMDGPNNVRYIRRDNIKELFVERKEHKGEYKGWMAYAITNEGKKYQMFARPASTYEEAINAMEEATGYVLWAKKHTYEIIDIDEGPDEDLFRNLGLSGPMKV